MTRETVGIILGVVSVLAALLWAARIARAAHRRAVARERATGHRLLRRRMAGLAGGLQDQYEQVVRAETMYGWVWVVARRTRGHFHEGMGWAPTRRRALVAAARWSADRVNPRQPNDFA